jgi:outer membrane lipoprotein SlyB
VQTFQQELSMDDTTTTGAQNAASSSGSWSAIPRAAWIGGGSLAIVAAAMGGALISRSIPNTPTPSPQVAAAPEAIRPVPLAASTAPLSALPMAPNDNVPPPQVQAPVTAPVPRAVPKAKAPVASRNGTTRTAQAAVCEKGEGTGLGAVTGGVLGGVVGNQVGGGNGKKALTVLGAIGGGFAGHEAEKRIRSVTHYEVRVRMDNGNLRTFERSEAMPVGTPVTVDGSSLRVSNRRG